MSFRFSILFFSLVSIISCNNHQEVEKSKTMIKGSNNLKVKEQLSDSIPRYYLSFLDSICDDLNLLRLSGKTPNKPDTIETEYRITYLPGSCFGPISNQGMCISFNNKSAANQWPLNDSCTFNASHFQYVRKDYSMHIDTIYNTVSKKVLTDIYSEFRQLLIGSYISDQAHYSDVSGSAPDYFFIEMFINDVGPQAGVTYSVYLKRTLHDKSNFQSMLELGMNTANFKWKSYKEQYKYSRKRKKNN